MQKLLKIYLHVYTTDERRSIQAFSPSVERETTAEFMYFIFDDKVGLRDTRTNFTFSWPFLNFLELCNK